MDKKTSTNTMDPIMQKLSDKVNKKAVAIVATGSVNDPNTGKRLVQAMDEGAKEFEQAKGRPMTYAEMRSMWG